VDHCIEMDVDGSHVVTLADILPERGPLRVLFIGKTPSPASVEAGHYYQGRMGKGLWKRLDEYGVLPAHQGQYGDDQLLARGFGMTDLCKAPRPFGEEPTQREYVEGWERVSGVVAAMRPRILVFVYKGALDKVLQYSFGWGDHKSEYGFNDDLMRTFGRRVFAFPLPGTACTLRESRRHLGDLATALEVV
jgi:double-stranded uracil-DNA glycosylase